MTDTTTPGIVAMIRTKSGDTEALAIRDTHGWAHLRDYESKLDAHSIWTNASQVTEVRPLVVIDPTDEQAVHRLADAFCLERWSHVPGNADECDPLTRSSMQAALRRYAAPEAPEEPTEMGARVIDADGLAWARDAADREDGDYWLPLGSGKFGRMDWYGLCRYRGPLEVRS